MGIAEDRFDAMSDVEAVAVAREAQDSADGAVNRYLWLRQKYLELEALIQDMDKRIGLFETDTDNRLKDLEKPEIN